MELKSNNLSFQVTVKKCSNCTFMELKSSKATNREIKTNRSNCTFMELKLTHLLLVRYYYAF